MEPAGQEEASGAPVEVELKLALDAAAMEAALSSPLLRERARGELRTRELRNTYYDTPDRRLHARKAVLRVREVEGRYVQTLKGARRPDGAVAARSEWEVELPGPEPRPDALDDPDAHELAGLLLPEELAPVFETRVRRRSLVAVWPDAEGRPAEIEVAFDDGVARADGRGEVPLSELELELLRGDAGALFGLAEACGRWSRSGSSRRTRRRAAGCSRPARRRPFARRSPWILDAGCTVGDALGRILSAALRHWLDNEPAAIAGRQPEGVHQTRVALRRLRSALALFEDVLTPEALERWDGELRWLLGTPGRPATSTCWRATCCRHFSRRAARTPRSWRSARRRRRRGREPRTAYANCSARSAPATSPSTSRPGRPVAAGARAPTTTCCAASARR